MKTEKHQNTRKENETKSLTNMLKECALEKTLEINSKFLENE